MNYKSQEPTTFLLNIDNERLSSFKSHGYLIVDGFCSGNTCQRIREGINAYLLKKNAIEVNRTGSSFITFNGKYIDENFPELAQLYDHQLLRELSQLSSNLATIIDRRIGLSINITPKFGKFEPHFDRHAMTAVLYINDDFFGGEMNFYPRIRGLRNYPSYPSHRSITHRILDRAVRSKVYLKWLARKIVFKPKAGTLLIFEGTRTYHQVQMVTAGSSRMTVQFGYDRPGASFDIYDYYGK